jgi:hypothetical protein
MGLLKKGATFTVFEVSGTLPSLAEIKSKIETSPTPSIEGSSQSEAFSFCSAEDVFDKKVAQGEAVLGFGVRHDKKTISKPLFKKKYKEALKKARFEAKQSKRKIGKEDKELIKQNIEGEMYAEVKPIEKHYEVLWDTRNSRLYFGSATAKVLAGFVNVMLKQFEEVNIAQWYPLSKDTKHAEVKGSRDNFQNAFMTWVFYETKQKKDTYWCPLSVKFLGGDTAVTVRGDAEASLEPYISIVSARFVDQMDLGLSLPKENGDKVKYEVTVKRGDWSFRGLKVIPEISHENMESAVFERSALLGEFVKQYKNLVEQYEAIRNDAASDKTMWDTMTSYASDRIKQGLEERA